MKRAAFILTVVATGLAGPTLASLTSYSGSLSVADGSLVAYGDAWNGPWSPSTTLTWRVTQTAANKWHYEYTLTVPAYGIGRLIVEASDDTPGPAFTEADMQSPASGPFPWISSTLIGNHAVAPENPGMPEDMYGIQLDSSVCMTSVSLSFDSDRPPVWGDFYAQSLGFICPVKDQFQTPLLNWVRNAGFTVNDTDPTDPACDGSILYHVLVPDSTIPAPAAVTLATLGVALAGWLRRRRRL
ncbi:MAG: hypothetical protein A2Y76_03630 [Planctomycetes bacterium RBG_13_60_9]|nr:MAG: hypothetical protein A2Y76_03630 [Planctomycetes bacterium RBG_13_60_9]